MATSAPAQRLPSPNSKYPFVGPNYQAHGEVAGYLYHPWTDRYYPDPKAQNDLAREQGVIKKDPSLGSQIAPIAAATAGTAAATEIGKAVPGFIAGLGSSAPATVAPTTAAAAPAATGGSGLLGVGGAGTTAAAGTEAAAGTGAATTGSTIGGLGSVGAAPLAAIAGATYLGGKSAYDTLKGKKDNSIQGNVGRGSLAIATGGLSEAARPFLMRKNTKQIQADKWGELQDKGVTGAQGMFALKQQQNEDPNSGKWTTGKYAGQEWSFEKAADLAKDDPSIFRNEYANLDTFGNEWSTYSDAKKDAITKKALEANLYDSKHGLIIAKDKEALKQIAASTPDVPQSTGIRSQTVSPGIRKDGSRINSKGLLGVGSKK